MVTKVQKWGNSLAVRIPRSYARDARLTSGSAVNISIRDGKIVVAPAQRGRLRLDDLLKGVTRANLHGEFDTGAPVGRESW
jgi:antitoxin MazE